MPSAFDDTDLQFACDMPTITDRYSSVLRPPAFEVAPELSTREWTMLGILSAGAAEEAHRIGNRQAACLYEDIARKCDKGAEVTASRRARAKGTTAP